VDKIATVRAGISLVLAFAVLLAAMQAIFLAYERRRLVGQVGR
jgi:cell division protein FtsL